MAIKFDTLEDEQKYCEAISALHVMMPTLAEDVADIFVRADETANLDYAETLINRAVDMLYGAYVAVERIYSNSSLVSMQSREGDVHLTDVRDVLLDAHSALVWSEVID